MKLEYFFPLVMMTTAIVVASSSENSWRS
jgi:hypothetical protein